MREGGSSREKEEDEAQWKAAATANSAAVLQALRSYISELLPILKFAAER